MLVSVDKLFRSVTLRLSRLRASEPAGEILSVAKELDGAT